MAAHLYWRVSVTVNGGSATAVAIAEVQMYDASGTSLATGGTASASSVFSGFPATNAFDGNFTSFWNSNAAPSTGTPQWIRYQFASAVDVATVRLSRRIGQNDQLVGTFTIEYSDDGSSWTTAAGPFSPTWIGPAVAPCYSFLVSGSGYVNVRAQVNATQDTTPPDCAELELRESAGGADVTVSTVQYAMAGAVFTTFSPDKAFDNNPATFWSGAAPVPGANWVGQALSRAVNVVQVSWQERNDAEYTEGPVSVTVQGSNNGGATWTDIGTAFFAAWTAPGQIQVVVFGTRQPMVTVA